jgi:tRNA nucleotidyltransferase (CCA-adding enzyme)
VKQDAHYEIIPVLNIHPSNYNDIQNVTDMSPEHVVWVGKYTENDPGLKDEIRLAKQFCKSCNAYGAESYINGFSGHIIDILIIYYGSFINMIRSFSLLNNISKENPVIIDVERHLKDPLKELNESKLSPLIIIDPVQPERNSAAALGEEKLGIFISACRYFLEKPDMSYFSIKRFNLDDKVNGSIKSIRRSSKPKVLKVYEEAIKHCRLNGFIVLGSGWDFEYEKKSAVIYLIFDKRSLSAQDEHIGPPLSSKQDAEKFKKKHGDKVFIKDNRLYAMIPRAYIDPEDFMKDFINKDFIKIRIRSIKIKKIIVR